jgi:hypothetical protein
MSERSTYAKDLRRIRKAAEAAGWTVKDVKNGFQLYPPDKSISPETAHFTLSCARGWKNFCASLKRKGLKW